MDYTIKHVTTEQELDATLAFTKRVFYNAPALESSEYSRIKWLERMKEYGDLMLYAESGGAVVGIVFGRIGDDGFMTVGPVATDKVVRGKGIARKLMAEIEIRAAAKGIAGVALGAAEAAEGFYLRLGYTGSLLVQSEKHGVDKLLSFSGKYPVRYTNVYDGVINQVCFDLDEPDRELRQAYERTLGDCWTQMVFGKRLLPETICIAEYGKVCVLSEYVENVKSVMDFVVCDTDTKPSAIMTYLKNDRLVILTGDYLRSSYIMRYIHHYENELTDGRDAEKKRARISRLCYIARANILDTINGFPSEVNFRQWLGDNTGNKPYLLPVRRMERILTDIRRMEEGINFDFLKSPVYIKPFVYVPSDASVPAMYIKYADVFKDQTVADIGTGTGILALLAAQSGAARVTAADINPAAVECAGMNVQKSGFNSVADVVESDLFENMNGIFDIILFNAPWVQGRPKNMYELAIYDNHFSVLKRFVAQAEKHLVRDGMILLQLSDISQQTDSSLDILFNQLTLHGFGITDSFFIRRKNRMFGKAEKVYLFEIRRNDLQ